MGLYEKIVALAGFLITGMSGLGRSFKNGLKSRKFGMFQRKAPYFSEKRKKR
jgi:hypothetical protein